MYDITQKILDLNYCFRAKHTRSELFFKRITMVKFAIIMLFLTIVEIYIIV